jgi:antitoxin component of MazEF toxin-antitoxin module
MQRTLDDYLSMVTPENIHPETETGDNVGREMW